MWRNDGRHVLSQYTCFVAHVYKEHRRVRVRAAILFFPHPSLTMMQVGGQWRILQQPFVPFPLPPAAVQFGHARPLSRYIVVRNLGSGAFGSVSQVQRRRDGQVGRHTAICSQPI